MRHIATTVADAGDANMVKPAANRDNSPIERATFEPW
jgi:hypothetical protein